MIFNLFFAVNSQTPIFKKNKLKREDEIAQVKGDKNRTQVIYLNGPSSSGKTTFAKALQEVLEDPFLHIGIDKIIGWMPDKLNDWQGGKAPLGYSWKSGEDPFGHLIYELEMGPFAKKIAPTFKAVVLTLAKMGHFLIIDDVSFGKKEVIPNAKIEMWTSLLGLA